MTNLVDEVYGLGKPKLWLPFESHDYSLAALGPDVTIGGSMTTTGALDPWSDKTIITANGTDNDVLLSNMNNIVDGWNGITVAAYVMYTVIGGNYWAWGSHLGSDEGLQGYVDAGGTFRTDIAAANTDPFPRRTHSAGHVTVDVWQLIVHCASSATYGLRSSIYNATFGTDAAVTTTGTTASAFGWPASTDHRFMASNTNSGKMTGRLCHYILWDYPIRPSDVITALNAVTAAGVWCVVDTSTVYQIDGTTQTTVSGTWDYWLYDNTTETRLYKQGTDFTIASGNATNKFYLPSTGSYYLVLRDQATGKAHSQTVTMSAA